jgi:branched-chain amino acid transport system permease protein
VNASAPRRVAIAAALVALLTLPIWLGHHSYYVNISSQILLWAIAALALNVLVGYAGLVSLGHAGLLAITGYTAGLLLQAGHGHVAAVVGALAVTLAASAVFAVLALRSTGIGFLMITLALGQIVWGVAYRWASLTNGDNGVSLAARPAPFGVSLAGAEAFYYATLLSFLLAVLSMRVLVRSPFGASVRGTRDQARRMTTLGYNVWLVRFLAFLLSGFWSGVAGLLYVYYHQFIAPPIVVMKNVVSAYIERWNLVLGLIFILIISFMPEGLVPGSVRLWRAGRQWLGMRVDGLEGRPAREPGS